MSKSVSYYDWELKFRSKEKKKSGTEKQTVQTKLVDERRDNLNSLGISESDYRQFMKKWKKKNLP
ncbi:MAG: hypothetical protein ACOC44_16810 [Promethearchaeia archaeon]